MELRGETLLQRSIRSRNTGTMKRTGGVDYGGGESISKGTRASTLRVPDIRRGKVFNDGLGAGYGIESSIDR